MAAIEEAITLYRDLANARPDAFTPNQIGALLTLGGCLTDLDLSQDAFAANREALLLSLELGSRHRDPYTETIEQAVSSLVIDLRHLGVANPRFRLNWRPSAWNLREARLWLC